jgi:hypothetical protein
MLFLWLLLSPWSLQRMENDLYYWHLLLALGNLCAFAILLALYEIVM